MRQSLLVGILLILSRQRVHVHVQGFAPRITDTTRKGTTFIFSKWDNLIDEDEDDGPPASPDMRYVPRNVMRQHQNFIDIRQAGGKELTSDVYVRDPGSTTFWFSGKLARVSDVSVEDAVARQWPLIEQHAANLRPMELYAHRGALEIWTAPGDSELEVAHNRPSIQFLKHDRGGGTRVKNSMVGFQGEMYEPGEGGFRTFRTEDGRAAKPEIRQPLPDIQEPGDETRVPTDEEMAQLEKKLGGQDLNALYEEQQRRAGKDVS
jgi:hypothetical protein